MTKRPLTDDEKKLCERSINRLKTRNNLIRPKITYYDWQLSQGLKIAMEEQYQIVLKSKREINEELYLNDMTIIQLQEQINNGVEIKKKTETKICKECGQEIVKEVD